MKIEKLIGAIKNAPRAFFHTTNFPQKVNDGTVPAEMEVRMPSRRQGGRSYGQTRSYMDEITERHTRAMLAKAGTRRAARPPDPATVAEHKKILEDKGLLELLEKGIPCPVPLPGNKDGIAIGITEEGCVLVKGWDYPFHPKVIYGDEPPRT